MIKNKFAKRAGNALLILDTFLRTGQKPSD